jgi:hypothetical protein
MLRPVGRLQANGLTPCARARRIGMDRVGAEAELDRRQGTARKHLQGGQPLSAIAARGRGLIRDPASQAGRLYAPGLAR